MCSLAFAIGPYSEEHVSSPHAHITFYLTLILSYHLRLGFLSCFFPSDLPTANFLLVIKKNSLVLSPLANYTDRAIAAGQRN
jgi:hypothetical protein